MLEAGDNTAFIFAGIFAVGLIAAAIWDVATARIPNLLNLALLLAFVPAGLLAPGTVDWLYHGAAAGIVLIVGLGLFQLGWLGGGDVKLMTATAFWTGLGILGWFALYTALAGGVLAVLLLVTRRLVVAFVGAPDPDAPDGRFKTLLRKQGKIPYGLAIAFGGLAVLRDLPHLG